MQHWKTSRREQKAGTRNTESPASVYSQDAPSDNPYSSALKNAPTHIDVGAPSAPQQAHHCEFSMGAWEQMRTKLMTRRQGPTPPPRLNFRHLAVGRWSAILYYD